MSTRCVDILNRLKPYVKKEAPVRSFLLPRSANLERNFVFALHHAFWFFHIGAYIILIFPAFCHLGIRPGCSSSFFDGCCQLIAAVSHFSINIIPITFFLCFPFQKQTFLCIGNGSDGLSGRCGFVFSAGPVTACHPFAIHIPIGSHRVFIHCIGTDLFILICDCGGLRNSGNSRPFSRSCFPVNQVAGSSCNLLPAYRVGKIRRNLHGNRGSG